MLTTIQKVRERRFTATQPRAARNSQRATKATVGSSRGGVRAASTVQAAATTNSSRTRSEKRDNFMR